VCPTRVLTFANDTEQRFRCGAPRESWLLDFRSLRWADVAALRTFKDAQKGSFDKTWTFPFDGTSYTGCVFDDDSLTITEQAGAMKRWALSLRFRQVKTSATYSSGVSPVFPQIRAGVTTQLPFVSTAAFKTYGLDVEIGQRYTYAARAIPLMSWALSFPALTQSELATLWNLFASVGGRFGTISFTDPNTGTTYPNCRFGQDSLQVRYLSAAVRSTSLQIEQFA
jgi:hypothetical protein